MVGFGGGNDGGGEFLDTAADSGDVGAGAAGVLVVAGEGEEDEMAGAVVWLVGLVGATEGLGVVLQC